MLMSDDMAGGGEAPAPIESSSEEVSSDEGSESQAPEGEEQQSQAPKKKYKVKIDDQEQEVDEDEIVKGYQLAKASSKRFQEASDLRKELSEFVNSVKQNPMELLKKLNITPAELMKKSGMSHKEFLKAYGDPYDIAEQLLMERIEEASLTPEQKRLRELEAKEKSWREREEQENKARMEKEENEKLTRMEQEYVAQLEENMVNVIQASGIKPTPKLIAQIAYELDLMTRGDDDMNISQAMVKKAMDAALGRSKNSLVDVLSSLEEDQLLDSMPPELVKKLNNAMLKKYGRQPAAPKEESRQSPAQPNKKKGIKLSDFFGD